MLSRPQASLVRELVRRSYAEFRDDHCQQMAAAISYHVLFSVFPLAIMAVGIVGLITTDQHAFHALARWSRPCRWTARAGSSYVGC
jgi:uncharacterized BrkB/YihY/UPF0761 family membrane protein